MGWITFLEYALLTVAGIFVIVNPLTTAFVFVSLLPNSGETERRLIAKRSVLVATSLFFLFALLGSVIFKLFGITLEAFRIAGGLILFGIAMGMIRKAAGESEPPPAAKPDADGTRIRDDVSVIPLAIPFISGPGSIATVMILTSEAPTIYHTAVVFGAVALTTFACYLSMIYSRYLVAHIGETGREIVTKVFGLILSVIAVQFVINGVTEVWKNLPR